MFLVSLLGSRSRMLSIVLRYSFVIARSLSGCLCLLAFFLFMVRLARCIRFSLLGGLRMDRNPHPIIMLLLVLVSVCAGLLLGVLLLGGFASLVDWFL